MAFGEQEGIIFLPSLNPKILSKPSSVLSNARLTFTALIIALTPKSASERILARLMAYLGFEVEKAVRLKGAG